MGLLSLQSNLEAITAWRQTKAAGEKGKISSMRLSSGYKINSAADDASGLAISEKMRAQIRGLDQGERNAADGINLLKTADGALQEIHNIIQRMREIAVQACNDTNNEDDRAKLNEEYQQLNTEIGTIAEKTEFNKKKLLDGSLEKFVFDHFVNIIAARTGSIPEVSQLFEQQNRPNPPLLAIPVNSSVAAVNPPTAGTVATSTAPPATTVTPPTLNAGFTDLTGNGVTVPNNSSEVKVTGDNAVVTDNTGKAVIDGGYARVTDNAGQVAITGDRAEVVNTASGEATVTGDYATVTANAAGGKVVVDNNSDYARVTTNEGDVVITGNSATVNGNSATGNIVIDGNSARVTSNSGNIGITGNNAVVTANSSNGKIVINGNSASINGNTGSVTVTGNGTTGTNSGRLNITGTASSISNSGDLQVSDTATVTNNSGSALLNGNNSRVTGTNSGNVTFNGSNASIVTNSGDAKFNGSGTATITTNSSSGRVNVSSNATSTTVTTNNGKLESHSTVSTTIDTNAGEAKIDSATGTINLNSPGGKIGATSNVSNLNVTTNYSGATIITSAANTTLTNPNQGTVIADRGIVTIHRNTASGTVHIKDPAVLTPKGANLFDTGTVVGKLQITGGALKASGGANDRFSVESNGELDLFNNGGEFVDRNSGMIIANASTVNINDNSGTLNLNANSRATLNGDNKGPINSSASTAVVHGDNRKPINAINSSDVTLDGNNKSSVKLESSRVTLTDNESTGFIEGYGSSEVNMNGDNDGKLFLFDTSTANIAGTNYGRVEIEKNAGATITSNDGYIRNFGTDLTVGTNNIDGAIDNYGVMNSNCVSTDVEDLRHHVSEYGVPTGGQSIQTNINVDDVKPLISGEALTSAPQYVTVYANGKEVILEAYWEEVDQPVCHVKPDGTIDPDVNCAGKVYELRFNTSKIISPQPGGVPFDGGMLTFDSDKRYGVEGADYTIDLGNDLSHPNPDVPYDDSYVPLQSTYGRSGFDLVYKVYVSQEAVYRAQPGLWIQTGANSGQGIEIWTGDLRPGQLGLKPPEYDHVAPEIDPCCTLAQSRVTNLGHSTRALNICDASISQVSTVRARIGAQQNRIEAIGRANSISVENLSAAESRIRDADMGKETMAAARSMVLSNAGVAMITQANQNPQQVLQLLK